jgi:hypothetical protein
MTVLRAIFALILVEAVLSLKARLPDGWGDAINAMEESLGAMSAPQKQDKSVVAWLDLPPRPNTIRTPKLALNFMIKDSIHNSHVWEAWLDQAKKDGLEVKVLIHAYANETVKAKLSTRFQQFLMNKTVESAWQQLFNTQFTLLSEALKDPDVTHIATVSESTIPVKPLSWMIDELKINEETRMCGDVDGEIAEAWWVMSRQDAELFNDHKGMVTKILSVHKHQGWYGDEEVAWYRPLRLRQDDWGEEAPLTIECTTLAVFNCFGNPNSWCDNLENCKCPKLEKLLPEQLTNEHPAAFSNLTSDAYGELLASPFWFARKFPDGAVSPQALIQ